MEFNVKIENGDLYIDGKYVAQLCFDPDMIGFAIASWLKGETEDD